MTNSRLYRLLAVVLLLGILAAIVNSLGSFRFNPDPTAGAPFIGRAQKQSARGIVVAASALGAHESRQSFGENLAKFGIQPIWLSIENETDEQLALLPITIDPQYYSPYEVSYRFHGALSSAANRDRDQFFLKRQIASNLPPHATTTGFLYGVLDAGVKYAHVVIVGNKRVEAFDFSLRVPGPKFVGGDIRVEGIYPGANIEDLPLDSFKTVFSQQPCCTMNSDGSRNGDPLNLVIVESKQEPIASFVARGWHLARQLNVVSAIDTARAFLFRDEFLNSPVSPLYVYGRKEDLALQKARSTINERIHARLWLTRYTFEGRRVWIGQVSRDIGVRLTDHTWNLMTHKIAPDVDFDRTYLLQDLLISGFVERYGYIDGVGAAPASAPRANLTGDPYYTDGLRAVIFLSNQTMPLGNIQRLPWANPPLPGEEAR